VASCFASEIENARLQVAGAYTLHFTPGFDPILLLPAGCGREVPANFRPADSERFNGDSTTPSARKLIEVYNIRPPVLRFMTAFVVRLPEATSS